MDENNEQFVAYFLPTPDTLQIRTVEEKETTVFDPEQESVMTSSPTLSPLISQSLHYVGMSIP